MDKLTFTRFTDIEQLHHLVSNITKSKQIFSSTGEPIKPFELAFSQDIVYKGKVKLHGQNAGITIQQEGIRAQSRNQFIDDSGFGKFVLENKAYLSQLLEQDTYKRICIFGEYAGKGVQSKVALSQLKDTIFAVFAIQFEDSHVMVEPSDVLAFLTKYSPLPKNWFVLPWHTEDISMNFMNEEKLKASAAVIDDMVQLIDQEDPWVKTLFGKSGPGEGLVMYPLTFADDKTKCLPLELFSAFVFKAKGTSHQVVKTKSSAEVVVPNAQNVNAFVDLVVTEARLLQGLAKETHSYSFRSPTRLYSVLLNIRFGDMKYDEKSEHFLRALPFRKRPMKELVFNSSINTESLLHQNSTMNQIPSPSSISISTTTLTVTREDIPQDVRNTQETTVPVINGTLHPQTTSLTSSETKKKPLTIHIKEEVLVKVRSESEAQQSKPSISESKPSQQATTNATTPLKLEQDRPTLTHQRGRQNSKPSDAEEEAQKEVEENEEEHDDEDDGKIYCICKTAYNPNLWMIACDICNEWFHGKCVQITSGEARKIQTYSCPNCQAKGIPIEYKAPKKKGPHAKSRSNSPVDGLQHNSRPSTPNLKEDTKDAFPTNDITSTEALLCSEVFDRSSSNPTPSHLHVKSHSESSTIPTSTIPSSNFQADIKSASSAPTNGAARQRKRKRVVDDDIDSQEQQPVAKRKKENALDLLADSCTLEANARNDATQKPPLYNFL